MIAQIYRLISLQIKRILFYREITFLRWRAAARERERQREEEERANRRAKAEKERERSHGRENRERAWERKKADRDRDRQYHRHYHQPVNFVPASESRRGSYILDDKEEEQRRQAKRKIEMEIGYIKLFLIFCF